MPDRIDAIELQRLARAAHATGQPFPDSWRAIGAATQANANLLADIGEATALPDLMWAGLELTHPDPAHLSQPRLIALLKTAIERMT